MVVGILLIATGKYKMFVQSLIDDIKRYFLLDHRINVYLFTDELHHEYVGDDRVIIIKELIPSYRFPEATLLRFHVFTKRKYESCSFLFYIDVDMRIEAEIGEEILGNIVAVIHPGFYNGGGSWETRKESATFVPEEKRKKYFAGGFNGGLMPLFYAAMIIMKDMIDEDKEKGIVPIWHDESALNKFLSNVQGITELSPSFCMVEPYHLRQLWGISHLEGKIIALDKQHSEIRS